MNIILFDTQEKWADLLPLTFTRPVADLRVGILTIREKWERLSGLSACFSTREYLSAKFQTNPNEASIWIDGSILPDTELVDRILSLSEGQSLLSESGIIAFRPTGPVDIDQMTNMESISASSKLTWTKPLRQINFPWDIFTQCGEAIRSDFNLLTKGKTSADIGVGNTVIGEHNVFLEEGARVNCAIINALDGPVYIGQGAEIMEGSVVRGSFALGDHSTLKLSAKIYGATSIGPHCKVGGEVFNSVFQGFSNKAHDGYLGNAVIGEWCNLGAGTNNSNLKNTYDEVKVWNYHRNTFIPTGLQFCGLIMGDHSKTGINTMLNTGTVIGVSANVFGSGYPRNFIPSFSWGGAHGLVVYQLNKALGVASSVMKRRNQELGKFDLTILEHVFNSTVEHRLG